MCECDGSGLEVVERRTLLTSGVALFGAVMAIPKSTSTVPANLAPAPTVPPPVAAKVTVAPRLNTTTTRPASRATTATTQPATSTIVPATAPPSGSGVNLDTARYELAIEPRSSWAGALRPKGPIDREPDVKFLLVHHTASSNTYKATDVPGLIRGFFSFHTGREKGWPDVAYNFFIDKFGVVWEARTGSLNGWVAGSGTGGNQGFSQLCCLIGDYASVAPTKPQENSLVKLLAALADRHEIDTSPGATTSFRSRGSNRWKAGSLVETPTINGHRSMSLTTCPGDAAFARIPSIRSAVDDLRRSKR